ncbi:GDYXXLXY domain-containing protein [Orrella sp. JC864]|uniref:GDYXXLXY domain-containing protein n=1 Tax=Orrella sp. JC864 TaxID=3120298 RepID=UPI003009E470
MPDATMQAPLQSAVRWQRFLSATALGLSVVLLASALVCLVAANWPALPVWARLSGAQALLVLCVALALALGRRRARPASALRSRAWRAALLLAGLVLGALLALLGQTYQTGADTWQLFAWWAALLLPWAWAGGTALWILWLLVANVALLCLLGERTPLGWLSVTGSPLAALVLGGFNFLVLGAWEAIGLARGLRARTGPRLAAALALGALTASVAVGAPLPANWLVLLALFAGLAAWYRRVRPDRVVLACIVLCVMLVSLRAASHWLWMLLPGPAVALPLAALLLAQAAWAARWLGRGAGGVQGGQADAAAAPAWYVQALLAFGAWLSSVLLLGFAVSSGLFGLDNALPAGLALCVTAAVALRLLPARWVFLRQAAVAVAAGSAALALAGLPWFSSGEPAAGHWAGAFGMLALLYAAAPDRTLRLLCALGMAGACAAGFFALHADSGLLRWLFEPSSGDALRTRLVPVAVLAWGAAAAFLLAYAPERPRTAQALAPLAWAWMLAAQGYAWIAGGVPLSELPALWALYRPAALAALAIVLLPVCCLALLASTESDEPQGGLSAPWRAGACLGVLALALLWTASPGISLALSWLILGQGRARRHLAAFGAVAGLLYLIQYYHHLQVPLLGKALWLAAAGALALLLFVLAAAAARRALRVQATAPAPAPPARVRRRYHWRAAMVVLGLAMALGLSNGSIWLRERTLAHGQVVRLALAPADPRSLMQGDYMALDFEVAVQMMRLRPPRAAPDTPYFEVPRDGYLILRPDAQGVARLVRLQQSPQPRGQGEIALRYRKRAGRVHVVTNAYFFPEGQAHRYQGARYGEFRVNEYGTGLLVRLLDERLEPL